MTTSKPAFKTIDFGVMAKAEQFAKENNVPDLVFPKEESAREGEGAIPFPSVPEASPEPARTSQEPSPKPARKAKPVSGPAPTRRVALELPVYLADEVGDAAHKEKKTVRYIITRALKEAGYRVEDVDLIGDGRRGQ